MPLFLESGICEVKVQKQINLQGQHYNLLLMQTAVFTNAQISVSPGDLPDETPPEGCAAVSRMILATGFYINHPFRDPPPLYTHERGFVTGVTPHCLLLANRTAACAPGRRVILRKTHGEEGKKYTLPEAITKCDEEEKCTFLVWEIEGEDSVVFCSDQEWEGAVEKGGSYVAVKPSEFSEHLEESCWNSPHPRQEELMIELRLPSLFLREQREQPCARRPPGVLSLPSVSSEKPNRIRGGLKKLLLAGLSTGLLSLPDFQEHLWLCSGAPTMIPMDGAVFAVKVSNVEGPSASSASPLRSLLVFVLVLISNGHAPGLPFKAPGASCSPGIPHAFTGRQQATLRAASRPLLGWADILTRQSASSATLT
ncbi:hypothetical protein Efla_006996 [Eimeria flavescens]